MTSFTLQLAEFARKAGERADDAVGSIVVRVAAEIDRRSPVGDATFWQSPPPKGYVGGRFRGNWRLGVDQMPSGVSLPPDPTGTVTQAAILASVPEKAAGPVYFLVNNLPYANRIENGWSRQAPAGVVGLTTLSFEKHVREAVEALG